MAILETLGQNPETRYHVRAVAEKAQVSVGSASIILRSLKKSRIVRSEQVGNMLFYKYNLQDPVARQWRALFSAHRRKQHRNDSED